MRALRAGVLAAAVCASVPRAAAAQPFDPVTAPDFTIDLYQGAVLGSARIVGMGGAQIAMAEGAPGVPGNPAAAAIRPATSKDTWDWDWNVDWHNPELGTDYDNNGVETDEASVDKTFIFTGGILAYYKKWGFAFSPSYQQFDVVNGAQTDQLRFDVAHISVARTFRDDTLAVGLGIRGGTFRIWRLTPDRALLVDMQGAALEAGAVWMPKDRNLRLGFSTAGAAVTTKVNPEGCPDPANCEGFILPESVDLPWTVGAGIAWRRADTRWNQKIAKRWRDEEALLLAADVLVTGPVDNGYGIEQYVLASELQPSGRSVVVSPRFGADYEWKPGRFRVRGGTYWEPARFENVKGRLHLTLGLELRVYDVWFWGDPYRLRITLTGDGAEKYGNGGVSIGFWH